MKAGKWREMSDDELQQKAQELGEELFNLRFQLSMGVAKTRQGVVVSDKMTKTRVVVIERVFRHPRYQRVITRSKRLKAHDERNASKVGDRVLIEETRPLSKEKRWRILQVLASAS